MSFRVLGEPFKVLGGQGGVLGGGNSGGSVVQLLFRDDFLTLEAAPLTSPRTAEPGPGEATIKDTTNLASIDATGLIYANFVDASDPSYSTLACARAAGLLLYGKLDAGNMGATAPVFGWARLPNVAAGENEALFFTANINYFSQVPAYNFAVGAYSANEIYEVAIIVRDAGAFMVVRNPTDYSEWTILYVTNEQTTATLYGNQRSGALAATPGLQTMRVSQLPAPWNTDFGIATDYLPGSRSAGDTYVHTADFVGEFICTTVPGAGTIFWTFRRQDASNYWEVVIEPNQDITLREVVATVPTARGTSAAVINNGDRIVVIADDENIRVFSENVLLITYALAANFKTETDGLLFAVGTGAVDDIVTWPRRITGEAKTAIDRVANA